MYMYSVETTFTKSISSQFAQSVFKCLNSNHVTSTNLSLLWYSYYCTDIFKHCNTKFLVCDLTEFLHWGRIDPIPVGSIDFLPVNE